MGVCRARTCMQLLYHRRVTASGRPFRGAARKQGRGGGVIDFHTNCTPKIAGELRWTNRKGGWGAVCGNAFMKCIAAQEEFTARESENSLSATPATDWRLSEPVARTCMRETPLRQERSKKARLETSRGKGAVSAWFNFGPGRGKGLCVYVCVRSAMHYGIVG
jgi:hypothetical protein